MRVPKVLLGRRSVRPDRSAALLLLLLAAPAWAFDARLTAPRVPYPGLFVLSVANTEQEQRWTRPQRFEGGVITRAIRFTPGAVNAYVMTSDAEGDATWQPVSAVVGTVNDDPFVIQDDADATKKMRFETSGITAGATRVFTVPNVTSTIAVLDTGQTFTRPQSFAPNSGTAITITPAAGGIHGITSHYTDTTFGPSPFLDQMWELAPTLSNPPAGGMDCDDFALFRLSPTFTDLTNFASGVGQQNFVVAVNGNFAAQSDLNGAASTWGGLKFTATSNSTSGTNQGSVFGISGTVDQEGTDNLSGITGGSMRMVVGSNKGLVTAAVGMTTPGTVNDSVTTFTGYTAPQTGGAGPITNWRAFNVAAITGGATLNNAVGLNMGNITKGTTSNQMIIGTSSSASPSIIWGKTAHGGNTAPTAIVDIQGTGATAPAVRMAQQTLTTPAEGDLWNDTNRGSTGRYAAGVTEYLPGVIFTDTSTTTVTNTGTETELIGNGIGTSTIPANFFTKGKTLRLTARGWWELGNAAADSIRWRVKYGSTVLYDSDRQTPAALGDGFWEMSLYVTCRADGASGIVAPVGWVQGSTNNGPAASTSFQVWGGLPQGGLVTLDTTAAGALHFTCDWGQASASDIFTKMIFTVEALN